MGIPMGITAAILAGLTTRGGAIWGFIAVKFQWAVGLVTLSIFRLALVTEAIAIEGIAYGPAFKRSRVLMSGKISAAVVIFLFGLAIGSVADVLSWLPTSTLGGLIGGPIVAILETTADQLTDVLVAPFLAIAFTLLYYDSRIRKEAFDLEILARNLETGRAPAAP